MTSRLRPLLTLPLALGLFACDGQSEAELGFRSQSDVTSEPVTLELDVDLANAQITSFQLGTLAFEGFEAAGAYALLDAVGEPTLEDGFIAMTLEGVQPIAGSNVSEGFIIVRHASQANEAPIAASRFGISIDGVGIATTQVVFAAPDDVSIFDFVVWQDSAGTAPAAIAPVAPVETIQYELVDADGNATICTAEVSSADEGIQIEYRPDGERARLSATVAPDCLEVLQAAAAAKPSEAFFVRCNASTTTAATKIPGLHKLSDVTLKRGVISATGEPAHAFGDAG